MDIYRRGTRQKDEVGVTINSMVSISLVFLVILIAYFSFKSLLSSDSKRTKKLPDSQPSEKPEDPQRRAKIIEAAEIQRKKTKASMMNKFLSDRPEDAARLLKAWLIEDQEKSRKS